LVAFLFILPFVVVYALMAVYAERKVSAFIQDRMGPMEVGPYGLLQTFADILKLLQKEDIIPTNAHKRFFAFAPLFIFTVILGAFSVLPLGPTLQGASVSGGVFVLLALLSLDTLGLLLAGWSSYNKYSLMGAMRAVSQVVSYEIPTGLSILCVVLICQTLDLQEICYQQGIYANYPNYLFGLKATGIDITQTGGFLSWNVVRMPLFFIVYIVFFIATLAECNRAPFDIPEAESELVGGFHTEYSGFRWAVVFLAEYAKMLLVSMLGVILFWGGWNSPLPNLGALPLAEWTTGIPGSIASYFWGGFWLVSKSFLVIFVQMWVRWTYPRLRVDQLMFLCWKVLTPAMLLLLLCSALWRLGMA
jgi:NADH-quinone oxidoreductase subunit H